MNSLIHIKRQFPLFSHQPDLIYLDNAATTQRPQIVMDALRQFYESENASIHRGLYPLSARATQAYEQVRKKVVHFIGADSVKDVAFTAGTTDSINRVANGFLRPRLKAGDNVVITALEHHANIIPWQQLAKGKRASLRVVPVDAEGNLIFGELEKALDKQTRLLALTALSNSIGTLVDLEPWIELAHEKGVPVLVDGAQRTGWYPLDVKSMGADFYVFSAHKMFGPFGVGVLYVAPPHQHQFRPSIFGGGIISRVSFEQTQFLDFPRNQEAGTPNVAGVIGLGAAVDFCNQLDQQECVAHVHRLAQKSKSVLAGLPGVKLVGDPERQGGIVSFTMEGVHPHDVAQFLGEAEIAVRAGHHCTQPLLEQLGYAATVRASFSIYNTAAEIDQMAVVLEKVKKFFGH